MNIIKKQDGVIAIFLSVILGILLLTTTTFAARVSVNELNQSSAVDRSEQAYFAAEAGIEEAIRRIDNNPNAVTCQIFPEQFYADPATPTTSTCPSSQPGDRFKLTETGNAGFVQSRPELDDSATTEYGLTSWRNRKVYAQNTIYNGVQAKDQTIQFDASELRRRCVGSGVVAGDDPAHQDCGGAGTSIFSNFKGVKYCWNDDGNPAIRVEVSTVSFASNYTDFQTNKAVLDHTTFPVQSNVYFTNAGGNCTNIMISNSSRRYIFRIKPIFTGSGYNDQTDANQFRFTITYQASLIESPPIILAAQKLYIPDDTYLIDVVGQSGDIKRRLVARKERKGRLLGIFDFVLYSGNESKDLCKTGVDSSDVTYDSENCLVGITPTAPSTTTLNYGVKKEASATQQPANPCDAPTSDSSAYGGNTLQLCSGTTFVYNYTYSGPNNPSKFILDAKQDIDTGAPGPAQIRVIVTTPSGSFNQIVPANTTTYKQYALDATGLNLQDGQTISVSIQFINDSCTGCSQNPRPADTDLNAYIDFFGLINGTTIP